jgi:hypothetical protein
MGADHSADADAINEALQGIEVKGFDGLATRSPASSPGTESLKSAFHNLAASILADLIQMTIKMMIFKALSAALGRAFGGGGQSAGVIGRSAEEFRFGRASTRGGGLIPSACSGSSARRARADHRHAEGRDGAAQFDAWLGRRRTTGAECHGHQRHNDFRGADPPPWRRSASASTRWSDACPRRRLDDAGRAPRFVWREPVKAPARDADRLLSQRFRHPARRLWRAGGERPRRRRPGRAFRCGSATYTLDVVGPDESDAIRAFKDQIRGATRASSAATSPASIPRPTAAASPAWSAPDAAPSTGRHGLVGGDHRRRRQPGDAPRAAGRFTLGQGDYIGFHWVATEASVAGLTWHALRARCRRRGRRRRRHHRHVEPPIPSAVPAGAIAYLNQPACVMALVTDQTKLQAIGRRNAIGGGQLVGIQDIRA